MTGLGRGGTIGQQMTGLGRGGTIGPAEDRVRQRRHHRASRG